jgi:Ca2+-binding RTX toxin-like protein
LGAETEEEVVEVVEVLEEGEDRHRQAALPPPGDPNVPRSPGPKDPAPDPGDPAPPHNTPGNGKGGYPPPWNPFSWDPLVLDLNGNGIEFIALPASGAHFDLNRNSFAEHLSWISPSDAFLVGDWNGDGIVNDGSEMFGDGEHSGHAALAAFDGNGDGRIDSADAVFASLRLWKDANSDGLTDNGELYTLPQLGVTSIGLAATGVNVGTVGGELVSVSNVSTLSGSAPLYSINLIVDHVYSHEILPDDFVYDPDLFLLPDLRGFGGLSDLQVAMTRDPTLKAEMIAFMQGLAGMSYEQAVSAARAMLFHWAGVTSVDPGGRGAGLDGREVALVELLTGTDYPEHLRPDWGFGRTINSYFDLFFRGYLTRLVSQAWGSDMLLKEATDPFALIREDVVYNPTMLLAGGDLVDGQFLFQEYSINIASLGQALTDGSQFATGTELQSLIIPMLRDMIADKYGSLAAAEAEMVFDFLPDLMINTDAFASGLAAVYNLARLEGGAETDSFQAPSTGAAITGDGGADTLQGGAQTDFIFAGEGDDSVAAGASNDLVTGEAGNDVLTGDSGDDHLIGGDGNDNLDGGTGDDLLTGDAGEDILSGGSGIDSLFGGSGNDLLSGGTGDDYYVVGEGSGSDTVVEADGWDRLFFEGGLVSSLARYSFANGNRQDLLIGFEGRDETVTIIGYFDAGAATVEKIAFSDGVVASQRQIRNAVYATLATAGDDVIKSFAVATTLIGLAGDDALTGRGGDDRLVGGVGDDLLSGGGGNDIYVFAMGDGEDVVRDYSDGFNGWGGTDTLEFAAGIAPGDVVVTAAGGGHDLVLSIAGTADRVTLDNDVNDSDYRIERIVFADGTVWTHAQLMAMALAPTAGADVLRGSYDAEAISGGAGDDTIDGRGGDDVIAGGPGNDLLSGSGGNDVYRFARGDGADTIRDYTDAFNGTGGNDSVEFAEGIAPADVTVSQADSGWSLRLAIAGSADSLKLESSANDGKFRIETVRFADATVWTHADLMALATAPTAGNDSIWGGYEAEALSGGGGDDVIDGRGGNDLLTGGTGNDLLYGSGGNDTYVFARGDGVDTVREYIDGFSGWGGTDTIQFAAGIAPGDVAVSQADGGRDLVLAIAGTADRIVIDGGLGGGSDYRVEQVRFADGTLWTWSELVNRSTGATAGNDSIAGDSNANVLYGLDGDDTLDGRQHNDILIGGPGNDLLIGSSGNDTYRFARGDGADMVREYQGTLGGYGGTDTIEFAEDIAPADIVVTESSAGGDLILTIAGTGDSVRIDGTVNDSRNRVERVVFADGTIWSHAQMLAMATAPTPGNDNFWGGYDPETISGGAGNDVIDGRGGGDVLAGNSGNDTLHGSGGDDIYLYARGDGFDIVADYIDGFSGWGGFDRLQFGEGIATADVAVGKSSGGGSYILYLDGGTGTVTLQSAITGGSNYAIEEVRFADGTVWAKPDLEARVAPGTNGADALAGDGGANDLRGLGGNDRLTGGEGSDRLRGDAGDDVLIGDLAGFDVLASGPTLLVNGSFEQAGTVTVTGSWGRGTAALPGWTKTNSQDYELMLSGYGGVAASDGSYWLDLESGGGTGSNMVVSQAVAGLAAGQVLILTFDHANRTSATSGGFELWWNGALVLTVASTGKTMQSKSLELVALAGDNVVTFKGLGTTDGPGASIDNVRLFATQGAAAGQDVLDGGDGNDLVDGGGGADLLSGGAGADVFRFDSGDTGTGGGADRIADFLPGTDRIDLSAIDADSGATGNQAFAFIGEAAFGGIAGQLRWRFDGTDTWIEGDLDGDGAADLAIVLSGVAVPAAADFIL